MLKITIHGLNEVLDSLIIMMVLLSLSFLKHGEYEKNFK